MRYSYDLGLTATGLLLCDSPTHCQQLTSSSIHKESRVSYRLVDGPRLVHG